MSLQFYEHKQGVLQLDASRDHLEMPLTDKLVMWQQLIREVLQHAERPMVSWSGGLHSSILLWLVRQVKKDIETFTINLGLFYPDQWEWMKRYAKETNLNWLVEGQSTWRSDIDFLNKFGPVLFKGLQHIPRELWSDYGISWQCRGVRRSTENQLVKKIKPDYIFIGILGDEKPQRMHHWLRTGYVHYLERAPAKVKAIGNLKIGEDMELVRLGRIPYPDFIYVDTPEFNNMRQGDIGCWMCTVRMKKPDCGNLGWLARHRRPLFRKLMLEFGAQNYLEKIAEDFPRNWLTKFLEKYSL